MNGADTIKDFLIGSFFSCAGMFLFIKRKEITDALIASNKTFWERIGFQVKERRPLQKITVPLAGIIWFVVGTFLIFRRIYLLFQ